MSQNTEYNCHWGFLYACKGPVQHHFTDNNGHYIHTCDEHLGNLDDIDQIRRVTM